MNAFAVLMPTTLDEALEAQARPAGGDARGNGVGAMPLPVLKAGGIDLLDHLKEGLIEPATLNNLKAVNHPALRAVGEGRIGPLATLADIGASRVMRESAPCIAQAAEGAATPQIRNVATAAGNLLQRPRCWYYRNEQFHCLKKGGHLCYAVEGENRYHAIFSDGPCYIVHPSNLAPALIVCDGEIAVRSGRDAEGGGRTLKIAEMFVTPDRNIRAEHVLEPEEIVAEIRFKSAPRSAHYEIREKQSFDWPLVMVAAGLEMEDDGKRIARARLCAGAVAPVPRTLPRVEEALVGVSVEDDAALRAAAARAVEGAKPMTDNGYKLQLLPVAVRRAVRLAAGLGIDDPFHAHAG